MEELQCKTVFTIPVFGGIPVAESVAVTWVIMAVLLILSLVLVRNLSVENPGKKQLLLETGAVIAATNSGAIPIDTTSI